MQLLLSYLLSCLYSHSHTLNYFVCLKDPSPPSVIQPTFNVSITSMKVALLTLVSCSFFIFCLLMLSANRGITSCGVPTQTAISQRITSRCARHHAPWTAQTLTTTTVLLPFSRCWALLCLSLLPIHSLVQATLIPNWQSRPRRWHMKTPSSHLVPDNDRPRWYPSRILQRTLI